MTSALHLPVMVEEVLTSFEIKPEQWYIDATFGRGGHTRELLKAGANIVAFDHDQVAIEYGQEKFEQEIEARRLILVRENFNKLIHSLKELTPKPIISGILFDFGTSVDQLKDANRGFSFESDSELDMRMDDRLGVKAKDLLALLTEKQLEDLFRDEGGEEESRAIAKAIVKQRNSEVITTTYELTDLIERVKRRKFGHLNPATKVFQALRIAVNSELDSIKEALPQAFDLLEKDGRIVTISFHEGEDRIVKTLFKKWEEQDKGQQIYKKPLQPTEVETRQNPRARSAKLRAFIKK
ncbi:MAG: 16S rRNA (cytosine(1402)-N(4))-methyltransferase RsmH [Patescibacteria group bacterium]